jgi:hypothetical protein
MTMYLNKKKVCSSSAIYGGTDGGLSIGNSTEKYMLSSTGWKHK